MKSWNTWRKRYKWRLRAALRRALTRASIGYAEYCLLHELWFEGPLTSESLLSCAGDRFRLRSRELLTEAARGALRRRLLVPVRGQEGRVTKLGLTRSGCIVFERVHQEVFREEAWETCYKVRRLSTRSRRVLAVNLLALSNGLADISSRNFIRRCHGMRLIGKWRFNEYKVFDHGISLDVVLGKKVTGHNHTEHALDSVTQAIARWPNILSGQELPFFIG